MVSEQSPSGGPRWDAQAQRWVWERPEGEPPAASQVYVPPPVAPPVSQGGPSAPGDQNPPGEDAEPAPQSPPEDRAAPGVSSQGPGAPGVLAYPQAQAQAQGVSGERVLPDRPAYPPSYPGPQERTAALGLPAYPPAYSSPPGQQPSYDAYPPYVPPEPPRPGRGRWVTPATAGIAVAALALGAGAVWFLARDTDDATRAGEKNGTVASGAPSAPDETPSGGASQAPEGTPSASGSPGPNPNPSGTDASAGASPGGSAPAAHETRQDPGGFTIAVPAGWAREETKDGVFYRSADRTALLQIFRVTEPELSPLDAVKASSTHLRAQTTGYEEISVGPVPGGSGAAELVYEYDSAESHGRRRSVERVFFAPDGGKWAVLTAGPGADWDTTREHHAAALAAFSPGG
ncbi:hypothetical protein [Streptomyces sp. NBC_01565]|uniref:hypothetical protein n=1 Tax=Streptomyces sp. NBC_01565 TaxID=2975881 RepID=UPI0022517EB3|nr:hypothetical protein [Streptomyces sp. NBC_01565]MCX4541759.1 hypothetical protein [Streptomyces sp. NBC_01565]